MALRPGIFKFRPIREIGRGGLGTVQEILITESNSPLQVDERFALKRLNESWAGDLTALERFEREIGALKKMSHANIVPVRGENLADAEQRFFVMPLYPSNLRHLVHQNPRGFRWVDVARFGATIADALQYAHNQGFIHRDLKPENILLDGMGQPVIADWGLGYFVHEHSKVLVQLTRGGMGTEYYCSIEQWATGKCCATGDVYSLGITLAELIMGFQLSMQHVGAGVLIDIVNDASPGAIEFNDTIKAMTQQLPNKRISTMADVAARLRTAADAGAWSRFRGQS